MTGRVWPLSTPLRKSQIKSNPDHFATTGGVHLFPSSVNNNKLFAQSFQVSVSHYPLFCLNLIPELKSCLFAQNSIFHPHNILIFRRNTRVLQSEPAAPQKCNPNPKVKPPPPQQQRCSTVPPTDAVVVALAAAAVFRGGAAANSPRWTPSFSCPAAELAPGEKITHAPFFAL